MSRVIVTGGNGRIGTVLKNSQYFGSALFLDTEDCDLRESKSLDQFLDSSCTLIHLAWKAVGNYRDDVIDVDNFTITVNAFESAARMGVRRVIVASSIHAHSVPHQTGVVRIESVPNPSSPYGAMKCFVEALGRHHANEGLEVVAIRFGGVNASDTRPRHTQMSARRWLSHSDCIEVLKVVVEADRVPDNYTCLHAVSNHPLRYHDESNVFEWKSHV